ncbi:MAG: ParB N-terminal domain-containing protein [Prevotella sp.]|nr:ParB N-terminal domain-containing protein [Prevotella sp.]
MYSLCAIPLRPKQRRMEQKEFQIVYRDISELVEPEYNKVRRISAEQREGLRRSLLEFGFVQPLVVNTHPGRENIVVGGNQRRSVAMGMGYDKAPCIEVDLPFDQEKALSLRLNKNQGEFDTKILTDFFDKAMLFDVGFSEKEIGKIESEFDEKFNSITNENCEMPIVAQFNERYDSIIIFCNNKLDFNWIRNVLKLERSKSYKSKSVGEAHVLTVQRFQEIWEEATRDGAEED